MVIGEIRAEYAGGRKLVYSLYLKYGVNIQRVFNVS